MRRGGPGGARGIAAGGGNGGGRAESETHVTFQISSRRFANLLNKILHLGQDHQCWKQTLLEGQLHAAFLFHFSLLLLEEGRRVSVRTPKSACDTSTHASCPTGRTQFTRSLSVCLSLSLHAWPPPERGGRPEGRASSIGLSLCLSLFSFLLVHVFRSLFLYFCVFISFFPS